MSVTFHKFEVLWASLSETKIVARGSKSEIKKSATKDVQKI